ncbi:MAG TPA: hypothetical protein VD978_16825 [Azospirillum sp.]|nr:hypothetical protein [Azospirillum sp.]
MNDVNQLRDALLSGARAGNFLEAVYASSLADREERDDLARELAAIHNEGLVDVVAAFEALSNNTGRGPDFFLTRHVLEKALPHLNVPVAPVMHCVLRLCREAGQDMAAGTIFNGYIEFCAKDAARPREALRLIEANPDALADMLPPTVAAGSQLDNPYYAAELVRLARHPDIEMRRRAVFSVARLHWPKGMSVPDSVINALEQTVAAETDDHILASAIKSAFALLQQDKALEERSVALIDAGVAKGDEYTLHAASELLWLNTQELPPMLLELLLTHLKRVKPENVGTLNNIDYGIAHLLKQRDPEQGLRFLEELLAAHGGKIKLDIIDSAAGEIRQSAALIGKILTRWFLKGEQALCEAVHAIAGTHHGDDLRIEIDASELKPADHVHIVFIARKAIGYFFMKPVTAASVVVSLMRHAPDDKTLHVLGKLLFDPLLLNYPGRMRDYIQEQAERESGKVKDVIDNALASIEQYLQTLRGVPNLPALHLGQSQRESYRRHMSESMAESMKAAEKKSIFFNLFARHTLLYGNKSINYIYAGDGEPRRMEMPLSSHSVEMDFPRMENIAPYDLNFMLWVFRAERFRP